MMTKGEISFGDIVWVEFDPSVGHEYQSKRSAIVVQSDEQLKKTDLVTIIPLTSQKDNRMPDDILVEACKENNLMSDSLAKVYCITSFDYARFEKVIGKIDEEVKTKIKNYLRRHFNIS
jgi:mRNA-degrading endonuclease toxin of MazEF toxin-antitoxin module